MWSRARPRGLRRAVTLHARAATTARRFAAAIGCLIPALAAQARAQGARETTVFLVPSARTTPSGALSFGAAVRTPPDSTRTRLPLALVLGLARSLEAGVQLEDAFSAPTPDDTAGIQGAVKWRFLESWHWRAAVAAMGWSGLMGQGSRPEYGGGVRISWAGTRSAVTASADGWDRGGADVGAALERTLGTRAVLAVEARGRGGARTGMLSARLGLGANATVAVGAGMQRRDGGATPSPVLAVAIGVVPRDAYLVPRAPRPRPARPDSIVAPAEAARAVPDLAAAVAREQAEDSAQRSRVVVPLVAPPSELAGGTGTWRWRPAEGTAVPTADDVRALADLVLSGRCPAALEARIEVGADAVPDRLDAIRRILLLLGVSPEHISLRRGEEAGDAIDVHLRDSAPASCPDQAPGRR